MRITQQQLRRIIQEEVTKMVKESRGGRHGTDWGYGSYSSRGDYPRGGSDEGWDDEGGGWGSGPSARELGFKVGDQVRGGGGKMGTVTKASEWDTLLNIEWDDGTRGDLDAKYAKKA